MRHLFSSLALFVGFTAFAQEPAKDTADALPKGAIARYGTERMKNLDGYGGARLHPNGTQVIGTVNGKPSLVDPATGGVVGPFAKGGGRNFSGVSADGSRAVSSSYEGFAVWDGKTAGVFHAVTDNKGVSKTLFNGFGLASGKQLSETPFTGFNSVRMAACPDGKTMLATAPDTGALTRFDVATGKAEPFAGGKVFSNSGPVFSPDGKRVAVAADNYGDAPQITVYDFESGEKTHAFKGHVRAVSAMAFSADGKTLATGSYDTTVLLWDVSKEQ
jgi:WD40 repeat protein